MYYSSHKRPASMPNVRVSVMMKKVDFLYPDWMNAPTLPPQRQSQLQLFYPAPFRPGHKISQTRTHFPSSTTSVTSFSGSDLLYVADGNHRLQYMDDLTESSIPGYERDSQRTRDLEIANRRPLYKKASWSLLEKASFDDGRSSSTSFQVKPPGNRSNGIRDNLIKGEQLVIQRTNFNSGRDSDALIAMGTLWSPANNNSITNNTTIRDSSSGPVISISSNSSITSKAVVLAPQNTNLSSNNSNSTNAGSQRKSSNSYLRLNHNSGVNVVSTSMYGMQLSNSNNKEYPKYQDPLVGAPASFQQRLMELASLEADTIRWERTRKVKKKARQDRDS